MLVTILDATKQVIATREIKEDPQVALNALRIDQKLLDAAGKRISMQFTIPILDIHYRWVCKYENPPLPLLEWEFSFKSAQQYSIPYWCGFNVEGSNVATVALSSLADDVEIAGHQDQMRSCYHFTVTVAIVPETKPFELYYSNMEIPWQNILAIWRKQVLSQGIPQFPDAAFLPVYCTWYAVHGALSIEFLNRNAALAAKMGFGTFIVDDGWSYDRMRRVCPEELALGWYRIIGDWRVSEKKLPDFQKHVAHVQSLGLKYLLWTAPFMVGLDREEYRAALANGEIVKEQWNEIGILDPRGKSARHVADQLENLMKTYQLDGLKIDFLDTVPCDINNPRSRASEGFFRELTAQLRAIKPDALFEFRQNYATPQMLQFGTQFRVADVPFDFVSNFQRLVELHMILGDKVPCHADPIYFHPEENAKNVGRHMIAALAGVPMLSVELSGLSPEQSAVITNYLKFYHDHLELWKNGHWSAAFARTEADFLAVEDDETAIVILANANIGTKVAEQFANKRLILLNLSGEPVTLQGGHAWNASGDPVPGDAAPLGGRIERQ